MISWLLDKYYQRPLLYDILLTLGILVSLYICNQKFDFDLVLEEEAGNLGSIGLTISGFILTLLTILLTVKSNIIVRGEKIDENPNAFQVFLASPFITVQLKQTE